MNNNEQDTAAEALHVISRTAEDVSRTTMRATSEILDVCDALSAVQGAVDPALLKHALRRIYEACAVQDLTEQRLRRILRTAAALRGEDVPEEDPLLAGPQSENGGVSQADIDDMLDKS